MYFAEQAQEKTLRARQKQLADDISNKEKVSLELNTKLNDIKDNYIQVKSKYEKLMMMETQNYLDKVKEIEKALSQYEIRKEEWDGDLKKKETYIDDQFTKLEELKKGIDQDKQETGKQEDEIKQKQKEIDQKHDEFIDKKLFFIHEETQKIKMNIEELTRKRNQLRILDKELKNKEKTLNILISRK